MNANYFLFATLEQARPIANGRVGGEKTQALTVLTGTPVAGMVYLDRPEPAGYFIFPDLSVRHEGKYRLSFSLYEEMKNATSEEAHVTHRLEVRSEAFTVYSAKKFPGLTESTSLSRMVAEQGCRVRIRRDIRMRRRETKSSGKDWDEYEDETARQRARMSATPDINGTHPLPPPYLDTIGRPRSASGASHQSLSNPLSRRTSTQEIAPSYSYPYGVGSHTPQATYAQSSPYAPSPSQQFQQPPFTHQPALQPPPPQYQLHRTYQSQLPAPPEPSYPGHRLSTASTQLTHPNQYLPSAATVESPVDYRRASMSTHYNAPQPGGIAYPVQPPASSYPPHVPGHSSSIARGPGPQAPMMPSHHSQTSSLGSLDGIHSRAPPPLQPVQPPVTDTGTRTPLSARPSVESLKTLPPPALPAFMPPMLSPSKLEPDPINHQDSYHSSAGSMTGKRPYASTFSEHHLNGALRQGARPDNGYTHTYPHSLHPGEADEVDDYAPYDADRSRSYRRADGRQAERILPRPLD
jgi:hypothetical protein